MKNTTDIRDFDSKAHMNRSRKATRDFWARINEEDKAADAKGEGKAA